jgi:hypothetical protein
MKLAPIGDASAVRKSTVRGCARDLEDLWDERNSRFVCVSEKMGCAGQRLKFQRFTSAARLERVPTDSVERIATD